MTVVNMPEAEAHLSRLVEAVESGVGSEVVIVRDGVPAAKLVRIDRRPTTRRPLGLLNGRYPPMGLEDLNADDEIVAAMIRGGDE